MPPGRRFFLDTAAHIERHAGESAVRQTIAQELEGETHATSTHVLREWRGIVYGGAIAILNACRDAADVGDVKARLRQGWGRAPSHQWLAFDMVGCDGGTLRDVEIRAEQFLRARADALFELDVDEIRDASECMLAQEPVTREMRSGEWKRRTMCRREECECSQVPFTDAREEDIKAAAAALVASDQTGHRKMGRLAQAAMAEADKTKRKGKTCWGANGLGGDISIALECARHETLLTTDQSFDHIGPAIGSDVLRVEGTRLP